MSFDVINLIQAIPINLLILLIILCTAAGWLLDNALGESGAGMLGNTLMLALGGVAGFYAAIYFGIDLEWDMLGGLTMAIGGAICMLLIGCFLRTRINF